MSAGGVGVGVGLPSLPTPPSSIPAVDTAPSVVTTIPIIGAPPVAQAFAAAAVDTDFGHPASAPSLVPTTPAPGPTRLAMAASCLVDAPVVSQLQLLTPLHGASSLVGRAVDSPDDPALHAGHCPAETAVAGSSRDAGSAGMGVLAARGAAGDGRASMALPGADGPLAARELPRRAQCTTRQAAGGAGCRGR